MSEDNKKRSSIPDECYFGISIVTLYIIPIAILVIQQWVNAGPEAAVRTGTLAVLFDVLVYEVIGDYCVYSKLCMFVYIIVTICSVFLYKQFPNTLGLMFGMLHSGILMALARVLESIL